MMRIIFLFCLFCTSCISKVPKDIYNREIVSSKGENFYVISLNWGITGDQQVSTITKNRDKFKNNIDTNNTIQGLNPFEYRFKNDTLTLYFRNKITYHISENISSIYIEYKVMEKDYYLKKDTTYHSVPDSKRKVVKGMPTPPR